MVPQKIVIINSDFPRNKNGKIDTNKLSRIKNGKEIRTNN